MGNQWRNGDSLPLPDFLAAMERIGTAPAEYREGYEAGFRDTQPDNPYDGDEATAFARGYRAGMAAYKRGAHGAGPNFWRAS